MAIIIKDNKGISRKYFSLFKQWSKKYPWLRKNYTSHDLVWESYSKQRIYLINVLNKIIKRYSAVIIKNISNETNQKVKTIFVYPFAYDINSLFGSKVLIGFACEKKYLQESRILKTLVHECVHSSVGNKLPDVKYAKDCGEIAAVLLTNAVIKQINKSFSKNYHMQRFHPQLIKQLKGHKKELYKIIRYQKDYSSKIKALSKFLAKKGFKPYFSRFK